MPDEIEKFNAASAEPTSRTSPVPSPPQADTAEWDVISALRRRWLLAATIAVGCSVASCLGIWTWVRPLYGAAALVRIAPIVPRILYDTEASKPMPLYRSFVNTQARLLLSRDILQRAVQNPLVQDLGRFRDSPVTVESLARTVKVKQIPNTQLLEVRMLSPEAREVAPVVNAVVQAYMQTVGENELAQDSRTIASLERKRQALRNKRKQVADAIRQMAEEYGTTALGDRQNVMLEAMRELTTALARAEVESLQAQARLDRLHKSGSTVIPAETLASQREASVAADPVVASLAQQLATAVADYQSCLNGNLTAEHRLVRAAAERVRALRKALANEKLRAAREFDSRMRAQQRELAQAAIAEVQEELARTSQLKKLLTDALRERDRQSSRIGKKGLAIEALQEELEAIKEEYERVDERLRQLETERQRPARISIASMAEVPTRPSLDKRKKYAVVAVLGSLVLAAAVTTLLGRLDSSVKVVSDLEAAGQIRVLGTVPRLKDLLAGRVSREAFAEAYRMIRACLCRPGLGGMPSSLLVTSAQTGEGKTGLAVSLAASIAETGQPVLLIDGDTRKPQLAELLKLGQRDGLSAALAGDGPLRALAVPCAIDGLEVLPAVAGDGQRSRSLSAAQVKRLIAEARRHYDVVIVDSPPVFAAADALVWAPAVEGVICAVLAGRSDRGAVWTACQRLRDVGAVLLGAVVANIPKSGGYYRYAYEAVRAARPGQASPTDAALVVLPEPPKDDQQQQT